jgi:prolyl oligopeptidase
VPVPNAATDDLPRTRRDEVVDALHGVEVADPYRWLEDATDPEVRAWVDQQRAVTGPVLAGLPAREILRDRLGALWSVPRHGVPWRRGGRWFQLRNDGTQDQDVLWHAPASSPAVLPPDDAWTVLLDPNAWTDDGTASLSGLAVTDAGDRVAYGRSDGGSDWVTWRVLDIAVDGQVTHHDEVVPWSKFTGAAWLPGGEAFLYGAYDRPPAGEEVTARTADQRLQRHLVGADAADDLVVHARPDQPEWGFQPHVAHGDRWLVLTVWRGTDPTNRVHVAHLDPDADRDVSEVGEVGEVTPLLDDGDARYDVVGVLRDADGTDELVVATDLDAPMGRVLAIDLTDPTRRRELVPESDERLGWAKLVGGDGPDDPAWLVLGTLRHATSRVAVHDARTGAWSHDVALPGLATVTAVTGGRTDRGIHLGVTSFAVADELWHHDLTTRDTVRVRASAVPAPEVPIATEQVLVHHRGHVDDGRGADEVAVPVFLVHREDVAPTGRVPTVLWGYGGFDIPVTPAFRPAWRAWVDAGGVLAVACLRGGGEYGRAWHDAGRHANRPAVQADALAVAAWLTGDDRDGEVRATAGLSADGSDDALGTPVDVVWSSPDHLGVEGRSNGGLLVGTCITAEPGRFASAVPEVGVLDLLRFHRFTIGWAWTSDYGSPDEADAFPVLHGLSPYHRALASDAVAYPATLVTTGDTDDRVVPAHSYKFAAALQAAQAGPAPVLLRVDVAAGHGAGKPVAMLLDERADVLAWHAHHLGLEVPAATTA